MFLRPLPVSGAVSGALLAVLVWGTTAYAATLPSHPPLRILVVSDEVNPHSLPPELLTQPGEISAALTAPGSGLQLDAASDAVVEIATDDLSQATARLSVPIRSDSAYDVIVYFAHRQPTGSPAGRAGPQSRPTS